MNAVGSKLYHTVAYSRGEVAVLVGLIGTDKTSDKYMNRPLIHTLVSLCLSGSWPGIWCGEVHDCKKNHENDDWYEEQFWPHDADYNASPTSHAYDRNGGC